MSLLSPNILSSPCWWLSHLSEAASSSDVDVYEYVHEAFGVTLEQVNQFYNEALNLGCETGDWPQFVLSVPEHSIVVTYHGEPRYEITYGHASGPLVSIWGVAGGNGMLPAFRWAEVDRFSRLASQPEMALLLLLPSCDIPRAEIASATHRIESCFGSLGYHGPLISRFAAHLALGCSSDDRWFYDSEFGWITENRHCWRCRRRPDHGLQIPDDESFFRLKRLTDLLEKSSATPGP